MTSTLQKWVLIIDIPKTIYELQKAGYKHFRADFDEDTRRVHLRAWLDVKTRPGVKCEGTPKEECDHADKNGEHRGLFNNKMALDVHQRAKKHGPYAEVKG